MKSPVLVILAICLALLAGCSRPPQAQSTQATTTAEERIQQIPPADAQKPGETHDTKTWRNPYLLVKKDGIWLVDLQNNEERPVASDHVLDALAALPASAWPYGRVVAAQEVGTSGSDHDRVAIRKNRAILAGTLEGAKVQINWLPSA